MKVTSFFRCYMAAILSLVPTIAFSQVENNNSSEPIEDGTFMTVIRGNPTYWLNEAGEFNIYIESEKNAYLLTLQNEEDIEVNESLMFDTIIFTKYSFLLHSSKNESITHYFAVESNKEKQLKAILIYSYPNLEKTCYYGYSFAKHEWSMSSLNKPKLENLQAAKSIYEVLSDKE